MSTETDRPARLTDNLGLPVPGDAEAADYVAATGDLADAIDALAALFFTPGDLRPSGSNKPRAGWLLCDGTAYIREDYIALFDAIGVAFGAGDGATTFNVPDLRSRAPLGAGAGTGLTNRALGGRGGEEAHAITASEMPYHAHGGVTGADSPDHAHVIGDPGHAHPSQGRIDFMGGAGGTWYAAPGWGVAGGGTGGAGTGIGVGGATARHAHGIPAEGGNGAHNNMPPFVAVNWLIKT